ncbi:MAG: RHS repeat-associated core domain-containing protein, partial [Phycisphaerae bacterium]
MRTRGGIADDISRVSEIADDDLNEGGRTRYAVYGYLGAGAIVTVEHPAVSGGLTLDYGSDGSGGWDDFGRVTGQTWTNSAETTKFDDFAYTYDRASNRTSKDLTIAAATGLDEKYTYDGLNRLANTERGTLTDGVITDLAFEQDWSLDELGNWAEFNQDDDGTGGWDLEQDRDHNEANEITDLSGSWVDPAHDAAGNMTLVARPGDETSPEEGLVLVYDAWNRPVKVYVDADEGRDPDAGELLATYEYDGQTRRIVETIEGVPAVVRDSYYSDAWQVIEVQEGGDADNPLKQFVWDPRYVDSPIVRFHDGNTDGAIDDTLYYATDANFNVTSVVDTSGAVVERYAYDPYGQVTILNGADGTDPDVDGETVFEWDPDADGASDVDNRTLYAGYHLDTETGLYHVRHRYYHPTLGRWISRDPIGYADGMSLYEYCRSGPLGATDATGLRPMGPQDPGYQPGYETLPWKDVPETDKKCPCPCGGDEFVPPWKREPPADQPPAREQPPVGPWQPRDDHARCRNGCARRAVAGDHDSLSGMAPHGERKEMERCRKSAWTGGGSWESWPRSGRRRLARARSGQRRPRPAAGR